MKTNRYPRRNREIIVATNKLSQATIVLMVWGIIMAIILHVDSTYVRYLLAAIEIIISLKAASLSSAGICLLIEGKKKQKMMMND